MIKKKICVIGEFGVGKTCIVNRYVENKFEDRYLTTIGVSIKHKQVTYDHQELSLIIWDIAGEQVDSPINTTYLRGLSGFVVVCDITQGDSFLTAERMIRLIRDAEGDFPYVVILNKIDKLSDYALQDHISKDAFGTQKVFYASAKSGVSVDEAFEYLIEKLVTNESSHESAQL